MRYLITGLGNIGVEYTDTRHNIGFQVVDHLAHSHHTTFETDRLGDIAKLLYKGRQLTLLKPNTYMNLSGRAVRYWLDKLKISPQQLLVITDDLHLPFGKLRLRPKGSHAGHNGLRNINDQLQTTLYPRLRFGIGNHFHPGKQSNYVVAPFSTEERDQLPPLIEKAKDTALSFCWRGVQDTMQRFNG
ncbi:MAG: aminoacyl-tRNA hydrolase [Bacteroidota bacterium]